MSLRVVFMGTAAFAVPALEAIRAAGHDIVGVYSQPPRPAGRGGRPRPGPVLRAAAAAGLDVRTPATLRDADLPTADAVVVAAYGLLLPPHVLAAPPRGCLNVHASLLPRWRGAAPIQRAIMAGDAETGISIMLMDAGLDTGPVLLRRAIPVAGADAGVLHDRLAALGACMIVDALEGDFPPVPQPADGATYAHKLERADEAIDWTWPAAEIARQVRALSPRPGARFAVDGEEWKLLAAEEVPAAGGAPGEALDDALTVACGAGALRALRVQRAGRRPMAAAEALRGRPVPQGARVR